MKTITIFLSLYFFGFFIQIFRIEKIMLSDESSNFDADYHPTSKQHRKNFKRWNVEENQLYIEFLKRQEVNFREQKLRRTRKVFKRLSEFIKSKNHSQCKSHHQKMVKHHLTIEKIIEHFTNIVGQNKNQQEKTKLIRVNEVQLKKGDIVLSQNTKYSSESSIFDVLQTQQKWAID